MKPAKGQVIGKSGQVSVIRLESGLTIQAIGQWRLWETVVVMSDTTGNKIISIKKFTEKEVIQETMLDWEKEDNPRPPAENLDEEIPDIQENILDSGVLWTVL
jgi:hypothetical protein